MIKRSGSDDLFRLIHSLTVEEKGYVKKFMSRHTSQGNNYTLLFDAINKQRKFAEDVLREKFKNYSVMKVYLKEMITDALLVYYHNSHTHINLLNQIQKIHLLIVKGFHDEALKVLDKALKQSKKMELFTIERYLLHIYFGMNTYTSNSSDALVAFINNYKQNVSENSANEEELTELELVGIESFLHFQKGESFNQPEDFRDLRERILNKRTRSNRGEMRKLNALSWLSNIQNDSESFFETSKQQVLLAQYIKTHLDSSYNTVPVTFNHLLNCLRLKKYAEADKLCSQMIAKESKVKLYNDLAIVLGGLYKMIMYYETAQFSKGLATITDTDKLIYELQMSRKDENWLSVFRSYGAMKVILLFVTEDYVGCWNVQNELYGNLSSNVHGLPGLLVLQMMVQFELKNFELLNKMAVNADRKIKNAKLNSDVFDALIGFFKQAKPHNYTQLAAKTKFDLKRIYSEKKIQPAKALGLIDFTHWLEAKATKTTIEKLVEMELAK